MEPNPGHASGECGHRGDASVTGPVQPKSQEVRCWYVNLDVPPETYASLYATLAGDERNRSERFRFERDRKRFVVARGALRDVLGYHIGTRPDRVRFAYNAFGKPQLSPEFGSRLKFNLSHSADLAVIAVAPDADVGVDVECVREEASEYLELARCFFSADDVDVLRTLPSHLKTDTFFRYWTKTEAYVKACGEGLADGPADVLDHWSFFTIEPAPGYIGTVAVEGTGWRLTAGHPQHIAGTTAPWTIASPS